MVVVAYEDAREFRLAIEPLIETTEARHNLVHGILATVVEDPEIFEEQRFWVTERAGVAVAGALQTPPMNPVLCDAVDPAAAAELARALAGEDGPRGVLGNRPSIEWFIDAWREAVDQPVALAVELGVFALDEVSPVPRPEGFPRLADEADAELLIDWSERFAAEALPHLPVDLDRQAAIVARLIERRRGSGIWLWERAGEVVSMSVHANPTPNGIRISHVYTPPSQRGRGFATALVAHQSGGLLEVGHEFCFLFTDLANPTSNAIYERIGYRQIAESAEYRFG